MNELTRTQGNMIDLKEGGNALATAESNKSVSEVIASLQVAKMFPRSEADALDKILKDCTRPGLADVAIYEYKRGGSAVTGPSIRLAEAVKRAWGNIESGWRELERRGDTSLIQAYAWDKESNVKEERTFSVKQVRDTKHGRKPLTDERDIYENNANQAARRVRACILALIPGDIIDAAVDQCAATLATRENVTTESIAQLVKAFEAYKVTKDMLCEYTGRNLTPDALSASMMVKLRTVYKSIKDGVGSPEDFFVMLPDPKPAEKKPDPKTTEASTDKPNLDKFKAENQQPQTELLKGEEKNG